MFHLPTMASHVWVFSINHYGGSTDFPMDPFKFQQRKKKEESHELSDKSHEQRLTDIKSNNPHLAGGEKTFLECKLTGQNGSHATAPSV